MYLFDIDGLFIFIVIMGRHLIVVIVFVVIIIITFFLIKILECNFSFWADVCFLQVYLIHLIDLSFAFVVYYFLISDFSLVIVLFSISNSLIGRMC